MGFIEFTFLVMIVSYGVGLAFAYCLYRVYRNCYTQAILKLNKILHYDQSKPDEIKKPWVSVEYFEFSIEAESQFPPYIYKTFLLNPSYQKAVKDFQRKSTKFTSNTILWLKIAIGLQISLIIFYYLDKLFLNLIGDFFVKV